MLPAHPHQLCAPFQRYQPQLSLRAFPPLYCGGETGKWTWLSTLIARCLHEALRGALSACQCHIWSGEKGIMDSILPFLPSLWFVTERGCHRFDGTVVGQLRLLCPDCFSGLHIRWQHGGWVGNERHTLLSENQANEGRNVLDHDMIPLLPLALLELSAKLLPIRVS